jgi:hypothetical protein
MTDQPVVLQKLHVILHRSLVESRSLALAQNCRQLYDLADTLEILPGLMARWDTQHLDTIRSALQNYQAGYRGAAYDYLSILDMDDREFRQVFQLW